MIVDRRALLFGGAAISLAASRGVGSAQTPTQDVIRILSVDGGGIRGIGAAETITALDEKLRARHGRGVLDTFDVFAGTSTGSIIAGALAAAASGLIGPAQAFPAKLVSLYEREAKTIFPRHWHTGKNIFRPRHKAAGLEGVLAREFGDIRLGQLRKGFLCTYYQLEGPRAQAAAAPNAKIVIARAGSLGKPSTDYLLRDVIRASTAAPTYFNPKELDPGSLNADGGLFANNPALVAYANARRLARRVEIVSVGTGRGDPAYSSAIGTWGTWEWISSGDGTPILDAFMRGQSDNVEQILDQLEVGRDDLSHVRLQYELGTLGKYGIDNTAPEYLEGMKRAARAAMRRPEVDALVDSLGPRSRAASSPPRSPPRFPPSAEPKTIRRF